MNPARSTSQAVFAGGDYIPQLWLFWVAPIIGGVLGALIYRVVLGVPEEDMDAPVTGDPDQADRLTERANRPSGRPPERRVPSPHGEGGQGRSCDRG